VAADPQHASTAEVMRAVAQVAREQLSERWVAGQRADSEAKARRVYYLSMEFLIGRTLSNALAALDINGDMGSAARAHAQTLEDLAATEADAALGNGGLGRLAACFLDSMATVELPSFGYGIRYEFGMFKQSIHEAGRRHTLGVPALGCGLHGALWRLGRTGR
jgi:glycogen phosphorylase